MTARRRLFKIDGSGAEFEWHGDPRSADGEWMDEDRTVAAMPGPIVEERAAGAFAIAIDDPRSKPIATTHVDYRTRALATPVKRAAPAAANNQSHPSEQQETASMLLNPSNLQVLFTGFKTAFNAGFAEAPTYWSKIAMETKSETGEEEYGWIDQFPSIREWLGDRHIYSLRLAGFRIKNRDFESSYSIPRNTIEDDKFGVFAPQFREMGRKTAQHPDRLIFDLMKAGFTAPCYDGQYFFDTDHPIVNADGIEESFSNSGGGAGAAWFLLDTSRALRPFIYQERRPFNFVSKDAPNDDNVFMRKQYLYGVDGRSNAGYGLWQLAYGSKQPLAAASYATARSSMMKVTANGGDKLGIMPTHLIVGPSNESAARKLLNNELGANGESNEWKGTAELIVCPWLD